MTAAKVGSHPVPVEVGTAELREIGQRLTRIRGQETQVAFAETLGLHKNTLGTYERGEREMGALALMRLAELGWNTSWLLTGKGQERLNGFQSVTDSSNASQPLNVRFLTIALELGDELLKRLKWAPKAHVTRVVSEAYQALLDGATPAELWQDLQDEIDKTEPGGGTSSGSQQEQAREVRRRRSSGSKGR